MRDLSASQKISFIMKSVIGTYTPDYNAEGLAQIDWVWVLSAILFIILVAEFFKAIRFVLRGFVK